MAYENVKILSKHVGLCRICIAQIALGQTVIVETRQHFLWRQMTEVRAYSGYRTCRTASRMTDWVR